MRPNREPPRQSGPRAYQSTINNNAYITMVSNSVLAVMRSHFIFKCILLFNMVPPVVSMPNHYDYDRLPAMHDGQDAHIHF